MPKYDIQVTSDEGVMGGRPINTDGFIILYMDGGQMKVTGKIELSELAPLLLKFGLEKMLRKQ